MRLLFPVLLWLSCSCAGLHAQQLVLGWSGGYATPRELNREIYVYNAVNSAGLKKPMQEVHWNQGPAFGYRFSDDNFYVELIYSRKRAMVSSEFDSSGIAMARQLKVLSNTYNFGFAWRRNGWAIGASFDAGRFKGKGRRGEKGGIKGQDWERLWVLDDTKVFVFSAFRLYLAQTLFVERSFGDIATVRLYAQVNGRKSNMDGLDKWLFGRGLNHFVHNEDRFTSYGVMFYFTIGKN